MFDHDASTKFALRGAHRDAKCDRCHTGTLGREDLGTACHGCHRRDDVHAGQQGSDCARCHNEHGWNHEVFFEHDLTRFPLLGLHAALACEECHTTPRYQDVASQCAACHAKDDVHERRLGTACARCHNPNGWTLVRFEHGRDAGYVLEGAHAQLDCVACHRTPVDEAAGAAAGCGGCHGSEDPHFGAFGRDCERCHDQTSWRGGAPGR
jgi:hypothetical protein